MDAQILSMFFMFSKLESLDIRVSFHKISAAFQNSASQSNDIHINIIFMQEKEEQKIQLAISSLYIMGGNFMNVWSIHELNL